MSYYSLSADEKLEVNAQIIKIVKEANEKKEFCAKNENGKIAPLNFKDMTDLIAERLYLVS